MKRLFTLLCLLLAVYSGMNISAQDRTVHKSFDLAIQQYGISFGNSDRFNGIRINLCDYDTRRINGLNCTFWRPKYNAEGEINGISLGLIQPKANKIRGLALGGIAVIGGTRLVGINIGGLTTVCSGDMKWINYGTIFLGSGDSMCGLNIGGLATISFGEVYGMSIGGLGLVARNGMRGINIGGLVLASPRKIEGLNFGGLIVRSEKVYGLTTGLLMTIGDESIRGLALSCGRIKTKKMAGISIAAIQSIEKSSGISFGLYNKFSNTQQGVSIGIFNSAELLEGVQIGLVNHAGNNPKWLRVLPLINLHL